MTEPTHAPEHDGPQDLPQEEELTQYDQVILEVFERHFEQGADRLTFQKDELDDICGQRGLRIRNIADIAYTYRARRELPAPILARGHWAIESLGKGAYAFRLLSSPARFDVPFADYSPIDIYNAIPEVVEGLLRRDEQSLLTVLLYNRLVDIFTGLTCFHIQSHYRAFVSEVGQVEVDALYVGVDSEGRLFVLPVEAKSEAQSDRFGRIQLLQMSLLACQDFEGLGRRVLAVKALPDGTIGLAEFSDAQEPDDIGIVAVRRYRLVRRPR
jgi:hypothetical protein